MACHLCGYARAGRFNFFTVLVGYAPVSLLRTFIVGSMVPSVREMRGFVIAGIVFRSMGQKSVMTQHPWGGNKDFLSCVMESVVRNISGCGLKIALLGS